MDDQPYEGAARSATNFSTKPRRRAAPLHPSRSHGQSARGNLEETTDLLIDVVGSLTNAALQELQLELAQSQAATDLLLQERPIAQAFIEHDDVGTVTVHGPQTVTAEWISAGNDYLGRHGVISHRDGRPHAF